MFVIKEKTRLATWLRSKALPTGLCSGATDPGIDVIALLGPMVIKTETRKSVDITPEVTQWTKAVLTDSKAQCH